MTGLRRRASGTLAVWSTAALIAGDGFRARDRGGFNPSTEPPVYPGSSRTIDTWKAVGTHGAPITEGASLTLRRAAMGDRERTRWLGHQPDLPGARRPHLSRARLLRAVDPGVYKTSGDRGLKPAADISLSLLETPMTAPATGFPKLLETR